MLENLPPLDSIATDPETLEFLQALVIYQHPTLIVEAGTYLGHFAILAARGVPDAIVYTADTCPYEWPQFMEPNIRFYLGDFTEMLPVLAPGTVDFAFIDSGPPFKDAWENDVRLRHYEAVKPYMKAGGLIVSHDMNATDWSGAETIRAEAGLRLVGGRGITIRQVQ